MNDPAIEALRLTIEAVQDLAADAQGHGTAAPPKLKQALQLLEPKTYNEDDLQTNGA